MNIELKELEIVRDMLYKLACSLRKEAPDAIYFPVLYSWKRLDNRIESIKRKENL